MAILIKSDKSKDVCIELLKGEVDVGLLSMFLSQGPIVGIIKDNYVMLQKRTPYFSNSFGRVFYGYLYREHNQTILEGEFKLFTPVKLVLLLMGSFHLMILLFLCYGFYTGGSTEGKLIFGLSIWIMFIVFAIVIYRIGRNRSLLEEARLVRFLEHILKDEEVTDDF